MLHALLLAASVAQSAPLRAEIHPEHLLVKLRPDRTAIEIESTERRAGARVLRDLPQIGWRILAVDPDRLLQTQRDLEASGDFQRVDFDQRKRLAYTPNDPYWPMWHMQKIRADFAWNTQKGSPSVVVAVMDTGVETSHPDLAANVWTNAGEIPANGVDDDLNGYVDDLHGWDFAYGDPIPDDVYGHGTACAGIVAAVQDNAQGVTGVAPRCKIAAIKASIDSGYFYDSANVPALVYCADMGFEVVSMSFFSDEVTPAERDAIDYCWSRGVLPVAAAGNASSVLPYYPGAYDHVLAVAATDGSDLKSWFSNWGSWVDVAAPGEGLSTTATGASYTTGFGGTSGATPHVAGLAALLFSAAPGATNAAVRAAIEDTALTLTQAPFGTFTGYGRVVADAALARVLGQSSGSKPARFLFAAPCGGSFAKQPLSTGGYSPSCVDFFGVGLETPNVVRVLRGAQPIPVSSQERDRVSLAFKSFATGVVSLEVNGAITGSFTWEHGPGRVFAPSDACTQGSGSPTTTGGFSELVRADGIVFTCTRNGDGAIYVQLAIRKVTPLDPGRMQLEFVRNYVQGAGALETIELYDWDTASYPYGSFVTVSTTAITSSATLATSVPLGPDPGRYLDDEGTMYIRLQATQASSQCVLRADQLRLRLL